MLSCYYFSLKIYIDILLFMIIHYASDNFLIKQQIYWDIIGMPKN